MKTIGLALGGGGARGIAHIAYLKALIQAKLKQSPLDIFERPTIEGVSTMEFYKFKRIYKLAEALFAGVCGTA